MTSPQLRSSESLGGEVNELRAELARFRQAHAELTEAGNVGRLSSETFQLLLRYVLGVEVQAQARIRAIDGELGERELAARKAAKR